MKKWNTIPRTYSEIDTLRDKFNREGEKDKLQIKMKLTHTLKIWKKFTLLRS